MCRQPEMNVNLKSLACACTAATLLSACVTPTNYNAEVPKSPAYQRLSAQLQGGPPAGPAQLEQLPHLVRVTLPNDFLFPAGGGELSPEGKALIARLAPALKDLPGQRVVVVGYTDDAAVPAEWRARFPSNVELTRTRADAIAQLLASEGVPKDIIFPVGLGDSHQIADDSTPQGRARNRRMAVDVVAAPA